MTAWMLTCIQNRQLDINLDPSVKSPKAKVRCVPYWSLLPNVPGGHRSPMITTVGPSPADTAPAPPPLLRRQAVTRQFLDLE